MCTVVYSVYRRKRMTSETQEQVGGSHILGPEERAGSGAGSVGDRRAGANPLPGGVSCRPWDVAGRLVHVAGGSCRIGAGDGRSPERHTSRAPFSPRISLPSTWWPVPGGEQLRAAAAPPSCPAGYFSSSSGRPSSRAAPVWKAARTPALVSFMPRAKCWAPFDPSSCLASMETCSLNSARRNGREKMRR